MADIDPTQQPQDQTQAPAAPAPAAPAQDTARQPGINSLGDAQAVARLIKEGKITGAGRDRAMADLRAFDDSVQHQQNAKGKNSVENMGVFERAARGFAHEAQQAGRGIIQAVADSPTALGQELRAKNTPQVLRQQVDAANKSNAPLMATTAGKIGGIAGGMAATGPMMAIPGAETLPGAMAAGAAGGAIAPLGQQDSRATNTLLGAAGGGLGQKLGQAAGYGAERSLVGALPGLKLPIVAAKGVTPEAREAVNKRIILPPSMAKAKPTLFENWIEGLGGKTRSAQEMSIPNQKTYNSWGREELGLPPGNKLYETDILRRREEAGQDYQKLRDLTNAAGFKNINFKPSASFNKELDDLEGPLARQAAKYPGTIDHSQILTDIRNLRQNHTPDDLVELSLRLRSTGDPLQRKLATIVDKHLDDNVQKVASNFPSITRDLFTNYIKARKVIAQTYDLHKAVDKNGNINSQVMRTLAATRPLSGYLNDIAKFGTAFEDVSRVPTKKGSRLGPEISKSEIAGATIAGAMGDAAAGAKVVRSGLYAIAPWVARKYLRSDLYQNTLRDRLAMTPEREAAQRIATLGGMTLANQQGNQGQEK